MEIDVSWFQQRVNANLQIRYRCMCAMQTAWLSERNLGSQFLSMARIQLPERGIHVVNIKVYEQISISIESGNCYPAKRQQSSQGHFGRVRAQNRPRVFLSLSKHADHNFRPANTATEKQSQVLPLAKYD